MTALLPRFLDASVLPPAELAAARLDGELYRVGEVFVPVDTPDTAELRAAAFAQAAPRAVIADRLTACWIHGVRQSPPVPVHVCVDTAHRVSALAIRAFDVRQCVLGPGDTVRIGDVRVTSPVRTLVDLLRTEPVLTVALARELLGLLAPRHDEQGAPDLALCSAALERHPRTTGTARARARLAGLARLAAHPAEQVSPR